MILLGWALDKPLALLFDPFESIVLYISGKALISSAVFRVLIRHQCIR